MDINNLLQTTFGKVIETFALNWPLLLLSILVSVALKLYVDQNAVARFLRRNQKNSVLMSTGLAVATPFCSCGTTAVILGMIASTVPWAPIVAFMVSSPLTSPEELIYSAGLLGWPFAITFFVASIILGLTGGWLAAFAESRGWLTGQARLISNSTSPRVDIPPASAASVMTEPRSLILSLAPQTQGASTSIALPVLAPEPGLTQKKTTISQTAREAFNITWKLLVLFLGFTFIGYFLNGLIPNEWIQTLFGSGRIYSIPLAATLGLPFYLNTEASMPLVRALIDSGMSQGSALAFLITGAGTSLGAITGAMTIARWRVIAIVLATLWVGAMLLGFGYDLLLRLMM